MKAVLTGLSCIITWPTGRGNDDSKGILVLSESPCGLKSIAETCVYLLDNTKNLKATVDTSLTLSSPKNLLNDTIKLFGLKADRNTGLAGFYAFNGLLVGVGINDIWKFLNLPGNNVPVKRGDGSTVGDFDMDFIYQASIGAILIASEFLFGIKHAAAFGGGLILGSRWANKSEAGGYIGNAAIPLAT